MLVKFLKNYNSSKTTYEKNKIYGAEAVRDDGSGLFTVVAGDGDIVLVDKNDIEIVSGATSKSPTPKIKGCCNESKMSKALKLKPATLEVKKSADKND